jgi:hypothetical protein
MTRKLLALLILPLLCDGQSYFKNLQKEVEAGVYLSTSGQNPFWLRSNRYGIVPLESQGVIIRARVGTEQSLLNPSNRFSKKDSLDRSLNWKGFTLNYAVEAVVNVGKTNQFLLPEAYAAAKWKAFEIYAGRRREVIGLVDSTLSSGSYIWSGNALPLPKIQVSIPNYTPILGKGLLSIKGSYAHGWFDNGYVEKFYLHQKSLYGRIGKSHWKTKFYAGFNHQVQWGGKPALPFTDPTTGDLITTYPSGWGTYLSVVTGQSLNKDGNGGNLTGVPFNEAFNRAGNHLGTIDIGADFTLNSGKLMIYRQSIYEDGSLFYLNNITDGLFGLSFKSGKTGYGINHIVFEYLKTSNQGGRVGSGSTVGQLRGGDNYFNNSLYQNAWTYQGNVIGTPFLTPLSAINKDNSNRQHSDSTIESYIVNNRVNAFSMSVAATRRLYQSVSRIAVSRNLGTYSNPFDFTSVSVLQEMAFPWRTNYQATVSFSLDAGKLYGTQAGVLVRVKRNL